MKNSFCGKSLLVALGAALVLTGSVARADDETTVRRHHRRPAKAHKAVAAEVETGATTRSKARNNGQIPTRDNRNSQEVQGSQVGGATGPEYRVPTGSHLPQRYDRKAYTTDRDQSSFIYDQNDQRLRGTNSVSDSLRSVPGVSIRGGR